MESVWSGAGCGFCCDSIVSVWLRIILCSVFRIVKPGIPQMSSSAKERIRFLMSCPLICFSCVLWSPALWDQRLLASTYTTGIELARCSGLALPFRTSDRPLSANISFVVKPLCIWRIFFFNRRWEFSGDTFIPTKKSTIHHLYYYMPTY